jgi:hypothetical protein
MYMTYLLISVLPLFYDKLKNTKHFSDTREVPFKLVAGSGILVRNQYVHP